MLTIKFKPSFLIFQDSYGDLANILTRLNGDDASWIPTSDNELTVSLDISADAYLLHSLNTSQFVEEYYEDE